jgi:2-polyprenyl-6-methoxyphenol hydroxylase-like FAD-dependent oxidoreductase
MECSVVRDRLFPPLCAVVADSDPGCADACREQLRDSDTWHPGQPPGYFEAVLSKAIVAGAGIGGLATAIALRKAGLEVQVLERVPELREIGAAVVVWPNGTRALRRLGVEPIWLAVKRLLLSRSDGRLLSELPVAELLERHGSGMMMVHRAELHAALHAALGYECIRLSAEVTGFSQDDAGVTIQLANGAEERADLVVGADGLRSAVRRQLVGDGDPVYQGFTAWRGEIPAGRLEMEAGTGRNWWGRGGEFLAFPLTDRRVYWAGTANAPRSARPGPAGHKQDVLDRFSGWDDLVLSIVSATDPGAILRTDIYDRPNLRSWSVGRVTLLGDAAHPMTPSQGQGACQALEDAVALGRSLEESRDVRDAFSAYERARLRRANRVVTLSRQASSSVQRRFGARDQAWCCRVIPRIKRGG